MFYLFIIGGAIIFILGVVCWGVYCDYRDAEDYKINVTDREDR